jgi:hypothetical protein
MMFSIALMLAFSSADSGVALGTLRTQIDAHRLQTGEFIYRDSAQGKVLGESSIGIRFERSDSNYHFSAQTNGYGDQRWEAVALTFAGSHLREIGIWQGSRSTDRLSAEVHRRQGHGLCP